LAENLRLAVLGAGSVGAFVGGLLSVAGHDVTLIGRAEVLGPIKSNGLKIISPSGSIRVAYPTTLTEPQADADYDMVFLTVRAYDVTSVAELAKRLASRGTIVTLQNGVGSEQELLEIVPRHQVVAATLTASVGLSAAGDVRQYNRNAGVAWADYVREGDRGVVCRVLESTGLPVWEIESPDSLRWSKLLLNGIGSALSVVLGMEVSEIVSRPDLFRIEQLAFRETTKVMAVAKIPVVDLPGYRVTLASKIMSLPTFAARAILAPRIAGARGGKPPSMLGDRLRGKHKTESEYLNGAVASAGANLGVETPVNQGLDRLVNRVMESEKDRDRFRRNPAQVVEFLRGPLGALPE
jgi:2-dehydropantoate 2-reductase